MGFMPSKPSPSMGTRSSSVIGAATAQPVGRGVGSFLGSPMPSSGASIGAIGPTTGTKSLLGN
jgi:hypothetical protein